MAKIVKMLDLLEYILELEQEVYEFVSINVVVTNEITDAKVATLHDYWHNVCLMTFNIHKSPECKTLQD